ncbi:GNAT family N-acetyltransferase [Glycomyces buryatensis]|uniref:Lysine N-acyltransferase MbtK n=1 Tax=Glycomyces buryatensis TaxID=2570927 RepID=A0A4S8QFZ6_9ACTN|nr:GNAT family N-acetyltransferase [Glycomyces buryatensis]THV43573.1 acetyltransferase [Glycomyces buryatensis]
MKAPNSFYYMHPELGDFGLRLVDPPTDAPLLHEWVTDPKAKYWMMQEAGLTDVLHEHELIELSEHHFAYVGLFHYRARFLVEVYDPAHSELADVYSPAAGDIGMHVLTAPTDTPVPGFTRAVMTAVMHLLFEGFGAERVVVEPDAENTPIHRLNEYVGFRPKRTVQLKDKRALLSFCTRSDFHSAKEALL